MAILLDGIFDERRQMSRVKTRQHILEKIQAQGLASAYARLRDVDPVYAAKIHPHDQRRIVRALEVYDLYGTPMSLLQKKRTGLWHTHQVSVFALSWERSVLYERINKRVDNMFAEGAIDEVRALFRKKISRTAQGIIGLKEIQLLLEGQMTESQAKEMIKRHTRHYAKRQLTWFRKDQRLNWMDIRTQERPAEVARRILHRVRNDG